MMLHRFHLLLLHPLKPSNPLLSATLVSPAYYRCYRVTAHQSITRVTLHEFQPFIGIAGYINNYYVRCKTRRLHSLYLLHPLHPLHRFYTGLKSVSSFASFASITSTFTSYQWYILVRCISDIQYIGSRPSGLCRELHPPQR